MQAPKPSTANLALLLLVFFSVLFLLHYPLLRLPYFWDEAGYYVPAARDLMLTGSPIPFSVPSNAHPPLVMAYLALCWRVAGFAPQVTRTAMLFVSAFSLLGPFSLARRVANLQVAVAATICTALYSVFFVQSSLAQVDLAAAGLTFWALCAYADRRPAGIAVWFSLAVLAKETAILAPLALFAWELVRRFAHHDSEENQAPTPRLWALLFPILPLAAWYGYHRLKTGFTFGNPEFFRYNVQATLNPLRIGLALLLRLWQTFGAWNLYLLVLAALLAMFRRPLRDGASERPRIDVGTQFAFLVIVLAYVVSMAVIGGAELTRYLLPAVPLVIIIAVSTLWRRVRQWPVVIALVVAAFVLAWFVNPPYGFSFEDNLAYRDYILLHQHAANFAEARFPMGRVLTAWPANDELSRPYLGYVTRPVPIFRIEDFTADQLTAARSQRSNFDAALVFSTKYNPQRPWFGDWQQWQEWKTQFFGYHRDTPIATAAQILGGRVIFSETRNGQWCGVIQIEPLPLTKDDH